MQFHLLLKREIAMKQRKVPAGCWPILILLALALLGCKIGDDVLRLVESADTAGCKVLCDLAGESFVMYSYETDSCWCTSADGLPVER